MGIVALIDTGSELPSELADEAKVVALERTSALGRHLAAHAEELELVVVGSAVKDPIQTTQQVCRLDPGVAVMILSAPGQEVALRDALQFAPFIGTDVECVSATAGGLVPRITGAVARTRARRHHRRTLSTLNSQLSLGSAPSPRGMEVAAHLLELVPVGIIATDHLGRVTTLNAEASRLLGVNERVLLGTRLDAGLGPEWSTFVEPAPVSSITAVVLVRRSPTVCVEVRSVWLPTSRGRLLVLHDVTEQERLAEAQRVAVQEAELASRLKDEFLAMVSHELRTPLTSILGWTRLLRQGSIGADKLPRALETIERNSAAQAKLIEDLLDMSRILTGKMRLDVTPVDVEAVLLGALDSVAPAVAARQILLEPMVARDLPRLNGDITRLQQVMWNLLSNAVKFTPRNGVIRVVAEQDASALVVRVTNTGPGIPEDVLPYIFDAFRQADGSMTRVHGGLGLGLTIVKEIVALHGGSIVAANEPAGAGVSMTVRLPIPAVARVTSLAAPTPEDAAPSKGDPLLGTLTGLTILVVDDQPDARDLVETVLDGAGAHVLVASSVGEAIALLDREARCDLVVSDIGMPGEDGYSLIAQLRAADRQRYRAMPALALTAYARDTDRAEALQRGFDAHVTKPVEPTALVALAERLTRRDMH